MTTGAADQPRQEVLDVLTQVDPDGQRFGRVLRDTFDQIYDGQHTGRYRWDQLMKTEKTHFGTIVEINVQREFGFDDGRQLDFNIAGHEVDCKFSQDLARWQIPPEAHDELILGLWANDEMSQWSLGVVRASEELLGVGRNRDGKATLSAAGREDIVWIASASPLAPNVLLQTPRPVIDRIMSHRHGTKRTDDLFRVLQQQRIGRGVVAAVAQQEDYMKRVRYNGGSRTALQPEGIIILGHWESHRQIAAGLDVPLPGPGESVSVRVVSASPTDDLVAAIDGGRWRVATDADPPERAPRTPEPRNTET